VQHLEVLTQPPPFLIGTAAFPGLDGWKADAALLIQQSLAARADHSPECATLLQTINGLQENEWVKSLLRPEMTAFLSNEPRPWTWRQLAQRLDGRPLKAGARVSIIDTPGDEMLEVLRKSGKGSKRDSCANASFLNPQSAEHHRYRTQIERALSLIEEVTPGFAAELHSLVDCIAFVDDQASFRGASGLILRGMVMLSPDRDWSVGVFAEELVHETTHTLLDLLSIAEPLLEGDAALEEKWTAPFRPDKRPLVGNFQALVVVSRLVHLFGKFRRSRVASELDWSARAADYAARSKEALEPLDSYPRLSSMARRLLDHLVKPTMALFPDGFDSMYPAPSVHA